MEESICGAKGESQLVSWPFKRYQGIRLKAINPTVFTPMPTLTAYITKPSSRLKKVFHEDFCCPRNPPLYPPHLLLLTQQQSGIQKKNIKIKRGFRDLAGWMDSRFLPRL